MNYPFNQPLNMNSQIRNILHWHIFPFVLERDASVHFTYTPKSTVWLFLALCRRVKHGYASISYLSLSMQMLTQAYPFACGSRCFEIVAPQWLNAVVLPSARRKQKVEEKMWTSKKSPSKCSSPSFITVLWEKMLCTMALKWSSSDKGNI